MRGSIKGIDVCNPTEARVIWLRDIVPSPALDFEARDGGAECESLVPPLDVGSEKLIDDLATSRDAKGVYQKEADIWHLGGRTIVDGDFDRTAIFEGRRHLKVKDRAFPFRIGIHMPGAKRVIFYVPDPDDQKDCNNRS